VPATVRHKNKSLKQKSNKLMRILDFQGKQTNLCGHGLQIRAIVAEINLRDRVCTF